MHRHREVTSTSPPYMTTSRESTAASITNTYLRFLTHSNRAKTRAFFSRITPHKLNILTQEYFRLSQEPSLHEGALNSSKSFGVFLSEKAPLFVIKLDTVWGPVTLTVNPLGSICVLSRSCTPSPYASGGVKLDGPCPALMGTPNLGHEILPITQNWPTQHGLLSVSSGFVNRLIQTFMEGRQ